MDKDISREMEALMYNFWIMKDYDKELYYELKKNQNRIKDFLSKNVGSNLIVHERFIKLEKIPTIPKSNMGIPSFTSTMDYILLTILLLFLEDKTKGDKFILSDLIDYIKNTAITLELDNIPDWNLQKDRRSLLNAISFLESIFVIFQKGDGEIKFLDSKEADALYEVSGTANYVMRIFDNENVANLINPEEFLNLEFASQEEKGDARRFKVFRNLLYTPFVSTYDLSQNEIDYIKKQHAYIKKQISDNLDMEVEITHNHALCFDKEDSNEKDNFPNNKKISEIVLMVNKVIYDDIKSNKINLNEYEVSIVKKNYLETIIKNIKNDKKPYLSKKYQDLSSEKFCEEVINYMKTFNFINVINDDVIIYPSINKMIGITKDVEVDNNEQIDLFKETY